MSFGGGKKTTTQTSENRVYLPGWIQSPLRDVVGDISGLMDRDYEAYSGDRLADFTPDELAAMNLTRGLVGQYNLDPSQAISEEVARRGLEGFSQAELDPYMSPYIENVLDVQKRRSIDEFDRQKQALAAQAGNVGAFGGSRMGLAQAQMAQDFQQQLAEQEALGLSNAYQSGLSAAMSGTQMAGQAGMDLANLTQAQRSLGLADAQALMGIGGQQRAMEQAGLDLSYEDWLNEQAFPYEQAQFALGSLLPIGQLMAGSNTTNTTTQKNKSSTLGKIAGIASLAAAPFTGGASLMGTMGSVGSALGGLGSFGSMLGSSIGSFMGGLGGSAAEAVNAYGRDGAMGPFMTPNVFNRHNEGGVVYDKTPKMYNEGGVVTDERYNVYDMNDPIFYAMNHESAYTPMGHEEEDVDMNFKDAARVGLAALTLMPPSAATATTPEYYDTLAMIESSNNPTAVNPKSGATGLYQFLPSVAKEFGLDDPTDPKAAREAVEKLTRRNAKHLKNSLGRDPSLPELYLAHQQGATGATALLENPDAKALDVLTELYGSKSKAKKAIVNNAGSEDMTAGEFAGMWLDKFSKALPEEYASNEYWDGGQVLDRIKGAVTSPEFIPNKVFNYLNEKPLWDRLDEENFATPVGQYVLDNPMEAAGLASMAVPVAGPVAGASIKAGTKLGPKALQLIKANPKLAQFAGGAGLFGLSKMDGEGSEEAGVKTPSQETPMNLLRDLPMGGDISQVPQEVKSLAQQPTPNTQGGQQQKQPESTFNMPLWNMGAAMLQSQGDFFQALGEGAQAYSDTKIRSDLKEEELDRKAQELELAKRRQAAYEQQNAIAMQKMNSPFARMEQEFKLAKLAKEVSGQGDFNKVYLDILPDLLKTIPDPEMAKAEARKIATEMTGGQGQNQGPDDFLNLLK